MKDILFRHIPSGADLMTRDLKMYMLGKERRWGGRAAEERSRRRIKGDEGTRWIKTAAK